ncbi:MAG: PIN domain-containing protein [Thermoguttaceae bacterium]|jgi:hypothetical protein
MIVVFDSNVWLSELGLRSGAGAAAKFFLNQNKACLAIPEVVRLEVQHNLQNRLSEHIEKIRTNYMQLLTAFGKLKEIVLPTDVDVQAKVGELFASVEVAKIEVPFTLDSARSSFIKTVEKLPPSDKSQEFKDGVLWADCLELLASGSVVLVTSDKAFYKDRKYENGLAQNLKEEISGKKNQLQIKASLSELLQSFRKPITLNEDILAEAFLKEQHKSVYGFLNWAGLDLARGKPVIYKLFATENPNLLFLEFSITYECTDIRGEGRTDALLLLKGDGSYNPTNGQFTELQNFYEHLRFSYRMPDGTEKETRMNVLCAGTAVDGHREVSSEIRYKLDSDDR